MSTGACFKHPWSSVYQNPPQAKSSVIPMNRDVEFMGWSAFCITLGRRYGSGGLGIAFITITAQHARPWDFLSSKLSPGNPNLLPYVCT